ncbi:hypothetical protein [Flavobacterium frigoris]|uniref:Pectate lyase superfamily protein n=1 Tax=Flavobacterium frigoris TaxID=229204 RepID=A0A1H9LMS0_FLAFI|nr:hypothetical protein [Flavobacterium frigoris]SER12792.1 hypothetical protein SAMN05444355_10779 [Flavobacterium frigoris]
MASLAQIYDWFMTSKKPTQAQFWASWGSFWNKGETIPQSAISNLTASLNAKAEKSQIDGHFTDANAHALEFSAKEDKVNKGVANGYVPLDEFVKIASQYLNIVNDLVTGGATSLLSAEQGVVLQTQIDGINILLSSDDINLDTVQEVVNAIKQVETSLETILVNDLTTGGVTKALTAEMGKSLKILIDNKLSTYISSSQSMSFAQRKDRTLYGIIDQYTGEEITFSLATKYYDGSNLNLSKVDGVMYINIGSEFFKRDINDIIDVRWFGVKGDGITDDSAGLIKALTFSSGLNVRCFVPKTTDYYHVSKTIRVPLVSGQVLDVFSNGALIKPNVIPVNASIWNLTQFREHNLFSFGPTGTGSDVKLAFTNNSNISIHISGFEFDYSIIPFIENTINYDADIGIALQLSAENIVIKDVLISNTQGYGIRNHGTKYSEYRNIRCLNVGGRGQTVAGSGVDKDAYGDAYYFSSCVDQANISLEYCIAKGIQSYVKRSRVAVTFEYGINSSSLNIKGCVFQKYSKMLHIEEEGGVLAQITTTIFSDFNFMVANTLTLTTICNFNNCKVTLTSRDTEENGSSFISGLFSGAKAKIHFENSTFDLNNELGAQITCGGVSNFSNCYFKFNNKNQSFSYTDAIFQSCTFDSFGGVNPSFIFGNYELVNPIFINAYGSIRNNQVNSSLNLKGNNLNLVINDVLDSFYNIFSDFNKTSKYVRIDSTATPYSITINSTTCQSPLWKSASRLSVIIYGTDISPSRDFSKDNYTSGFSSTGGGLYIVDFKFNGVNWVVVGVPSLIGSDSSSIGMKIKTTDGGVTWTRGDTASQNVYGYNVIIVPKEKRSYFETF